MTLYNSHSVTIWVDKKVIGRIPMKSNNCEMWGDFNIRLCCSGTSLNRLCEKVSRIDTPRKQQ